MLVIGQWITATQLTWIRCYRWSETATTAVLISSDSEGCNSDRFTRTGWKNVWISIVTLRWSSQKWGAQQGKMDGAYSCKFLTFNINKAVKKSKGDITQIITGLINLDLKEVENIFGPIIPVFFFGLLLSSPCNVCNLPAWAEGPAVQQHIAGVLWESLAAWTAVNPHGGCSDGQNLGLWLPV